LKNRQSGPMATATRRSSAAPAVPTDLIPPEKTE
jgi:hypothetical protein